MNKQGINMSEIRGKIYTNVENLQKQRTHAEKAVTELDKKINELGKTLKNENNYRLADQKQARNAMKGRLKAYKEERKELKTQLKGLTREIKAYEKGANKTADKIEKLMNPGKKGIFRRKQKEVDQKKLDETKSHLDKMNKSAFDWKVGGGSLNAKISGQAETIRQKALEVEEARESHQFQVGMLARVRNTKIEAREVKSTIDKKFKGPEKKDVKNDTEKLCQRLERQLSALNVNGKLTGSQILTKSEMNEIKGLYKELRGDFRDRRKLLEKTWINRREIHHEVIENKKKYGQLEKKKSHLEGRFAEVKAKITRGGKEKRKNQLKEVRQEISSLKERTRMLVKVVDQDYQKLQERITKGGDLESIDKEFRKLELDFTTKKINFPMDPAERAMTERRKRSFEEMRALSDQDYKTRLADIKNPRDLSVFLERVLASGTKEDVAAFSKTVGSGRLSSVLSDEDIEKLKFHFRDELQRFKEVLQIADSTPRTDEDYKEVLEALQDAIGKLKETPALMTKDAQKQLEVAREKLEDLLSGFWKLGTSIKPENAVDEANFWDESPRFEEFKGKAANLSKDTKKYRNYLQALVDNKKVKRGKRKKINEQIEILNKNIEVLEKLEAIEDFQSFSELFDRNYLGDLFSAFIELKQIHHRREEVPFKKELVMEHFGSVPKGIDSFSSIFVQLAPRFELFIKDLQKAEEGHLPEGQESGFSDLLMAIQIGNQQLTASER